MTTLRLAGTVAFTIGALGGILSTALLDGSAVERPVRYVSLILMVLGTAVLIVNSNRERRG